MNISGQLVIEQKQSLIISEEMKQSLLILAAPALELSNVINEIAITNPVIEVDQGKIEATDHDDEAETIEYAYIRRDMKCSKANLDVEYNDVENIESSMYTCDLSEYLQEQANFVKLDEAEYQIVVYFIGLIDQNGYFQGDIEKISESYNIDRKVLLRMLELIQTFEPSGVGARDLRECLLIQLRNMSEDTRIAEEIVANHLQSVASNSIKKICQSINQPQETVVRAIKLIKQLAPKPGRAFESYEKPVYVVPEVYVKNHGEDITIAYNDQIIPLMNVSNYYSELFKKSMDEEVKEYLEKKIKHAHWIMECLEKRKHTLLSIMRIIVRNQKDFFVDSKNGLRSLTQQQVAEEIGVHPSTISRAIKDKYVQTESGVYPISSFFLSDKYFEAPQDYSINHIIKKMITDEDKVTPLSDQMICNMLREANIVVARRTIAKYREKMNIPSASLRRRY